MPESYKPVFAKFKKENGREPFGRFGRYNPKKRTVELEINRRLRDEGSEIIALVKAHEGEHAKDYKKSGVNSYGDPHLEARAHLATLREATSNGRTLDDYKAKTKMGGDVIADLQGVADAFHESCKDWDKPPTYEPNGDYVSAMSNALWNRRQKFEQKRKKEMRSKLVKIFAGTTIFILAGMYLSLGAVYAPDKQINAVGPVTVFNPSATLANTTVTPIQRDYCVPVTGDFNQAISAWKTRFPGEDIYYYGQVDKIGSRRIPCR